MDFSTYISHVTLANSSISPYQFECVKSNCTQSDYEAFLYGKLYSSIKIVKDGENFRTDVKDDVVGYAYQFLDFHFNQYKGQKESFLYFIERAMILANSWPDINAVANNKAIIDKHIHAWIESKIKSIEIEKQHSLTKSFTKNPNKFSYQWQGIPEEDLPELYCLMKGKLIDDSTTFEQFNAVFTNQPIEKIKPIKWHSTNASELLYFVLRLEMKGLIKKTKKTDYQRLKSCFIKLDNSPFTEEFKSLKQSVELELSPDKKAIVNNIVDQLL